MALIRMYQRRGTLAQWNTGVIPTTVILQPGEIGIETDTGRFKIGNGENVWVELPYYLPDNNPTNDEDRQGRNNHDLYAKLSPLGPQYAQTFTGSQLLVPQSASQVPLIVSGLNGPPALLQRWRSYNDTTLASIDSSGKLVAEGGAYFNNVVDVNNHRITNVAAPSNDNDAVSKLYVDNAIAGLAWKEAVHLIAHGTGNNVALTGNTGTLVIDGHDPLVQADSGIYRILLTAQTTASQNGIYVYNDNGTTYTLVRATDADNPVELQGSSVYVQEGTTYGTSSWVQSNYTMDAFEEQVWVQFSGAALITAGLGMTKDGNTLDVNGTTDRITANADSIDIASTYVGQTSITTLGTITTGTWDASVIGAIKGGTGLSSYSVGDILYADTTTSLAKLIPGTAGHPLVSGGTGNAPSYSELGTGGIADDAVTYAKIQNVSAQYRVLGRLSSGSGNVEELNPDNLMTIINQGTSDISFSLLPVGTTSTTVAQGDHTHTLDNLSDVVISGTPALRQVLKYDGTKWINELPSGGISIGATPPLDASSGDAWFDSTDGSLYVYYDDGVGSLITNFVTNPSFEVNTSGWSGGSGAILTRVTSESYSGTASLDYYPLGSAFTNTTPFTVTASKSYTASAWVKGPIGKTINLDLYENTSAGANVGVTNSTHTFNGSWQRISVTRAFGATGTRALLWFKGSSIVFGSEKIYIDAIQLEQGSVATTYFDGSTPGGTWTGTPHASTSTKVSTTSGNAQWVQVKANSALEGSILTRLSAVEARDTKLEAANAVRVANATERNSVYPAPVQGNTVFRADLGYEQKYYAAYNATTNPDGTTGTPGWYEYRGGSPLSENFFLNSDFRINQRNASGVSGSGSFVNDRWFNFNTTGIAELANQTFTAGTQPVPGVGSDKYLSFWNTMIDASTGYASLTQRIEDVRTLAGRTVTVSFWAKAESGTPNLGVSAVQNFGSGGSAIVITSAAVQVMTSGSTWSRYSFTINVPNINGKTIGTSSFLQILVFTSVGTSVSATGYPAVGAQSNTFYFWNMQIEEGPVPTPFRRNQPNIQAELAACQRYYYRFVTQAGYGIFGTGVARTTTGVYVPIKFPVSMRIPVGTLETTGTAAQYMCIGSNTVTCNGLPSINTNGTEAAEVIFPTAGSLTVGQAYMGANTNTANVYLGFNAEL